MGLLLRQGSLALVLQIGNNPRPTGYELRPRTTPRSPCGRPVRTGCRTAASPPALAGDAVVSGDWPHPLAKPVPSQPGLSNVVLAGLASMCSRDGGLVRAGSARHRVPLVLAEHERSHTVYKNGRPHGIQASTSAHEAPWGRVQVPHPAAASPPGSCPRGGGRRGPSHPVSELGAVATRWAVWSFLAAVPSTCHMQRSPAVTSGQPRSLEAGRWAGRPALTWGGGGGRNCMACNR